jgi:hypothetical protein
VRSLLLLLRLGMLARIERAALSRWVSSLSAPSRGTGYVHARLHMHMRAVCARVLSHTHTHKHTQAHTQAHKRTHTHTHCVRQWRHARGSRRTRPRRVLAGSPRRAAPLQCTQGQCTQGDTRAPGARSRAGTASRTVRTAPPRLMARAAGGGGPRSTHGRGTTPLLLLLLLLLP